MMTLH